MWGWIALNAAYLVYAVSGLFRDMLRLRVTLLTATGLFVAYGLVAEIWSVVWWNVPVAVVHAVAIVTLLRQRRAINLGAEAEAVRTLLFSDLEPMHFTALWETGEERSVEDDVLIEIDQPVDDLLLILDGEVDVLVRDDLTVRLGRLRMIGEMSAVTGGTATATVQAVGPVRLRAWNKERFSALIADHPEIERSYLRAVGQELTRKLS